MTDIVPASISQQYDIIGPLIANGPVACALLLCVFFMARMLKKNEERLDSFIAGYIADSRASTAALTQVSTALANTTAALDRLTQEVKN